MKRNKLILLTLCLLSSVLLSLPWLLPHTGAFALVAFVPLLYADAIARQLNFKGFWIYSSLCFLLWNAATTFWVCEATMGGGIVAVLANAVQMSLIWLLYRLCAKLFKQGPVAYIFLATMWIAWEKRYFDVDISWPWLTLGNAFADSTQLVQWYEYTGSLGGSLWVWMSNLAFFAMLASLSDGSFAKTKPLARVSASIALLLIVAGPLLLSKKIYSDYQASDDGSLDVIIAQPNFDPYEKFGSLSQAQQNDVLIGQFRDELEQRSDSLSPLLLIGPETFTNDIFLNNCSASASIESFSSLLEDYPYAELLLGASTYELVQSHASPNILAYEYGDATWLLSRNSALLMSSETQPQFHHKNKLVVGSEKTPYPKIFVPIDKWLSNRLGVSSLIGRCYSDGEVRNLTMRNGITIGCAICYESVYGDYCREYVNDGAKLLTVITNDAWWGNTPGYRQHLNYSRLRAIELRRDVARCGNTGISAIIDQRGEILECTPWWEEAKLRGTVQLNSAQTFFVRHGDMVGRISTLVFLLLAALTIVRLILPRR